MQRWQTIKALFEACLALPPDRRAELLDRECRDAAMHREVESLLAGDSQPGTPLGDLVHRAVRWHTTRPRR